MQHLEATVQTMDVADGRSDRSPSECTEADVTASSRANGLVELEHLEDNSRLSQPRLERSVLAEDHADLDPFECGQ